MDEFGERLAGVLGRIRIGAPLEPGVFMGPLVSEAAHAKLSRYRALADEARALAEDVRGDGQPRTTEPLNAYERRVVHIALTDEPGVSTRSVGEGAARRVTVAPSQEATPPPEDGDASSI